MKILEAMILSIIAVLAPLQAVLITTGVLILSDLLTGVIAARKRQEPITSAGLRRTLSKMLIYNLALITGFIAEKYMIPLVPISKIVSSMIALVEIKSIYENLDCIQGGSLFKSIIDKIGSENSKK